MIQDDDSQNSQNKLLRPSPPSEPNKEQFSQNANNSKTSKSCNSPTNPSQNANANPFKQSKSCNSPNNQQKNSKSSFLISNEKGTKEVLTCLKDSSKLKALSNKAYNPTNDAIFEKGDPVPFCFLVNAFEEVAKCKGENSKEAQKNILSNVFKSIILLRPDHLMMTYYLCILKLAPDYIPSETGIGNEILTKSISKISGRSEKQIRDSFNKVIAFHFF